MNRALTSHKEAIIEKYFKDPRTGLGSLPQLYQELKNQGLTYSVDNPNGITHRNIKEWQQKQEVYQVMKRRNYKYQSFIPNSPLDQFQIDLIYMDKSWFNNNYKYILTCVDVFSKKADAIPLKKRDKTTVTNAFKTILRRLGIPKSIYSDQGSEFNNDEFLRLLKEHNITPIFAVEHAPFIESFNRNLKNRMYKYMAYHNTKNWSSILPKIIDAYNNTKHTSTRIKPNDINESNIDEARLNMMSRAKTKTYERIQEGDRVRVPVVHKVRKGYKAQWSYDIKTVDKNLRNGLYQIEGEVYPRRELQLIKGDINKPQQLSPAQQAKRLKEERIGQAMSSRLLKEIADNPTKKQVAQYLQSTRYNLRK